LFKFIKSKPFDCTNQIYFRFDFSKNFLIHTKEQLLNSTSNFAYNKVKKSLKYQSKSKIKQHETVLFGIIELQEKQHTEKDYAINNDITQTIQKWNGISQ
jgi:hypothetical protein